MNALKAPAPALALNAGNSPALFGKITPSELERWKEARRLKLLERQKYWANTLRNGDCRI